MKATIFFILSLTFFSVHSKEFYNFFPTKIASIIKIKPKVEPQTYTSLNNEQDREKVIYLFSTMGSHGKIYLLLHKKTLKKVGKEIEHVHPLKLLGYIFSNPGMKTNMDNIYHDYFKWNSFMNGRTGSNGLKASFDHEHLKDNLLKHLSAFAKEINMDENLLKPYFDKKDWEGLVKFLIYYP